MRSWFGMRVYICLKGTTETLKWDNSLGLKNFLDVVAKVSLGQYYLILRINRVTCEICTFLGPTTDLENQKLPWGNLGICVLNKKPSQILRSGMSGKLL